MIVAARARSAASCSRRATSCGCDGAPAHDHGMATDDERSRARAHAVATKLRVEGRVGRRRQLHDGRHHDAAAASWSSATSSPASSPCSCRWTSWNDVFLPATASGRRSRTSLVGPFIAFISFVCSIGNVPMAAALWHGGISFGGVISFIFADLITLRLLLIYRKYYGTALALRLFAAFWAVMSAAGLVVEACSRRSARIPTTATRDDRRDRTSSGTTRPSSTSCSSSCSASCTGCTATASGSAAARATPSTRCAACRSQTANAPAHRHARRRTTLVLLRPLPRTLRSESGEVHRARRGARGHGRRTGAERRRSSNARPEAAATARKVRRGRLADDQRTRDCRLRTLVLAVATFVAFLARPTGRRVLRSRRCSWAYARCSCNP